MSNRSLTHVLLDALRQILVGALKLLAVGLAAICKLSGILLTKIGETIEKLATR